MKHIDSKPRMQNNNVYEACLYFNDPSHNARKDLVNCIHNIYWGIRKESWEYSALIANNYIFKITLSGKS